MAKARPEIGSILEAQSLYKTSYLADTFRFPWNPDPIASGNNYRIYDEMRDDDQIKVALAMKKDMVINSGWAIECEDEAIRDFVTDALQSMQDRDDLDNCIEDCFRDILSSYEYGFSMTEPVYKLEDGLYTLDALRTRPPHSFRFDIDDKGNIKQIIQNTSQGDIFLKPRLFMHHVYQPDFGNPYGRSDLRAAHNPWKAKKFVNKFLAIYLERFATPTVVGKYPETWDSDEVMKLQATLQTIQQATTLALPETALVEFVQANKDSSDTYLSALHYYNLVIARAILMPDLLGMSGEKTSGGSLALGKEHFKLFMGTIQRDRDALARKFTLRVIRPMVLANFGDVECEFNFNQFTLDDSLELQKIWVDAVGGKKMWTPNDDEINHLRTQLGYPIGPIEVPEPQPIMSGDGSLLKSDGSPFGPPAKPQGKPGDKPGDKKLADDAEVRLFRDLTTYERKVNFTLAKRILVSSEQGVLPKLEQAARKVYTDYIQQIKDSGFVRGFRPERINAIQPKHLRDMNVVLKRYMKELFSKSYSNARQELFPMTNKKFAAQDELLPEDMIAVIEAESFSAIGDYSSQFTKRAKSILIEGMKEGASEGELVNLLREEIPNITERWLQTMIRTKTTDIYNRGRKSYWDNDPMAQQIIEAYQFSAIMDERTSDVCASLDGEIFETGDFANKIVPPLHFNCRSVLVPVTKFEDYSLSKQPSIGALQDLGGNLILNSMGIEVRAIDNEPELIASGEFIAVGDQAIIAPPGVQRSVVIKNITVCNLDQMYPVMVGFREKTTDQLKNVMLVQKGGGQLIMNDEWRLPEATGLFLNFSAPIRCSYTCRYIIVNKDGKRVR